MFAWTPPVEESVWLVHYRAMGPYGIWLALSSLTSLCLTIALLLRGRGNFLAAALFLSAGLPLVVGTLAFAHGMVAANGILAASIDKLDWKAVVTHSDMAFVTLSSAFSSTFAICICILVGGVIRSRSRHHQT